MSTRSFNKHPKITVITVVKNSIKTIERAIKSLLNQNYPNLEFIVIDGISTDGTIEVIEKYKEFITKFISESDRCAGEAYNKGLKLATGELIQFLNADDYYEGNVLNGVGELFSKFPKTEIFTVKTKIVSSNNHKMKIYDGSKLELNLKNLSRICLTNARFFRNSVFKQYGNFEVFDEKNEHIISSDREFLFRLLAHGLTTRISQQGLYVYFSHPNSMTINAERTNILRIHLEHLKIIKRYIFHKGFSKILDKYLIIKFMLRTVAAIGNLYFTVFRTKLFK